MFKKLIHILPLLILTACTDEEEVFKGHIPFDESWSQNSPYQQFDSLHFLRIDGSNEVYDTSYAFEPGYSIDTTLTFDTNYNNNIIIAIDTIPVYDSTPTTDTIENITSTIIYDTNMITYFVDTVAYRKSLLRDYSSEAYASYTVFNVTFSKNNDVGFTWIYNIKPNVDNYFNTHNSEGGYLHIITEGDITYNFKYHFDQTYETAVFRYQGQDYKVLKINQENPDGENAAYLYYNLDLGVMSIYEDEKKYYELKEYFKP